MLGINALVVERHQRIGDNWRKRYAALCLHDPICESDMPTPFYTFFLSYHDDDEGKLKGSYREIGESGEERSAVAGLWYMMGNLALCRFHSKHLALCTHHACSVFLINTRSLTWSAVEIKAYQENVFGVRYSSGNQVIHLWMINGNGRKTVYD